MIRLFLFSADTPLRLFDITIWLFRHLFIIYCIIYWYDYLYLAIDATFHWYYYRAAILPLNISLRQIHIIIETFD